MNRILLVDDEPRILAAHRRILHRMRNTCEIATAIGGEAALEELRLRPVDIVVSDMRMPGMDGAEFMSFVREEHPSTIRILLTATAEMDAALRCVPAGHQFLSKPCGPEILHRVLRRTLGLRHLLGSPWRALASSLQSLPIHPAVFDRLQLALTEGDESDESFAELAALDSALAAKILQLASSHMFGSSKSMSVAQAAKYLGADILGRLVRRQRVLRPATAVLTDRFCLEAHQEHATFVAGVAARLIDDPALAQQAFTAGLLHDIGQLVLATCLPEQANSFGSDDPVQGSGQWSMLEETVDETTRREAGAYLLSIWGLPERIVDVVAFHAMPHLSPEPIRRVVGAVHVADVLANAAVTGCSQPHDLDLVYVDQAGLRDIIPKWWAMLAPELESHGAIMRRAYRLRDEQMMQRHATVITQG